MTLHEDPTWTFAHKNDYFWRYKWCLDCDNCNNHVHLEDDPDPRMSNKCTGWILDIDGKDYCPECQSL